MIPDFFNQELIGPKQIGVWAPILGVLIVFLGMNMRIEIKIQKEEDLENED